MIDPDFWSDEKLGSCKRDERLLFMGLISNSDDEGYGRANTKLIKASIFPYDDDIKPKDIERMFCGLKGLVYVYVVEGQEFYFLPNFLKHQVINKPTDSRLPKMPKNIEELQLPNYYGSDTVMLPPNRKEEKLIEKKLIEKNITDFFETVWKLYPRKEGKGQISNSQKETLYKIGFEEIARCISRYKTDKAGTEYKFLKQGSTFFNSGYVDYLDKNYTEPPPKPISDAERKAADYEKAKRDADELLRKEGIILE